MHSPQVLNRSQVATTIGTLLVIFTEPVELTIATSAVPDAAKLGTGEHSTAEELIQVRVESCWGWPGKKNPQLVDAASPLLTLWSPVSVVLGPPSTEKTSGAAETSVGQAVVV